MSATMLLAQAMELLMAHGEPPAWLSMDDRLRWSSKYGDWLRNTCALLDSKAALAAKEEA